MHSSLLAALHKAIKKINRTSTHKSIIAYALLWVYPDPI